MMRHAMILTVERTARNLELLTQLLGREGYQTLAAATLEELDQILAQTPGPEGALALAVVDLGCFGQSIWPRCDRLREQGVPLLVLLPACSAAAQQDCFAHGAAGVLVKPCAATELLGYVRRLTKR